MPFERAMFSARAWLGRDVHAQNRPCLAIHDQGHSNGPKPAGVTGMPGEREFYGVALAVTQQRAALQPKLKPALQGAAEIMKQRFVLAMLCRRDELWEDGPD
jgi:hypothetical protein